MDECGGCKEKKPLNPTLQCALYCPECLASASKYEKTLALGSQELHKFIRDNELLKKKIEELLSSKRNVREKTLKHKVQQLKMKKSDLESKITRLKKQKEELEKSNETHTQLLAQGQQQMNVAKTKAMSLFSKMFHPPTQNDQNNDKTNDSKSDTKTDETNNKTESTTTTPVSPKLSKAVDILTKKAARWNQLHDQVKTSRIQIISEIKDIFPVVAYIGQDYKYHSRVINIILPDSGDYSKTPVPLIAAGMGDIVHLVNLIAKYLDVCLPFPMKYYGSQSCCYLPEDFYFKGSKGSGFQLYIGKGDKAESEKFLEGVRMLNENIRYLVYMEGKYFDEEHGKRTLVVLRYLLEMFTMPSKKKDSSASSSSSSSTPNKTTRSNVTGANNTPRKGQPSSGGTPKKLSSSGGAPGGAGGTTTPHHPHHLPHHHHHHHHHPSHSTSNTNNSFPGSVDIPW